MHYQKSDDQLKPYVDYVRNKEETKSTVLSLAASHGKLLESFCVYVRDVLNEKAPSLDDAVIRRIACIVLSTYGFYF